MLATVDSSTPAVVLKLDPNVFHHGGLGVIRSLGRLGVDVYAVTEDRFTPASGSRYLRGRWVWRPEPDRWESVRAGLMRLSERIGARAVLLPTDDAGALLLAEHGDALRDRYLFPAPDPGLPRRVADKCELGALCAEHGMPAPRAVTVDDRRGARAFAEEAGFPVVAKLAAPWRGAGRAVRSTTVLHDIGELIELVGRARGARILLQEYLPGGADNDWFVHFYSGTDGRARPLFVGRKLRSYPAHAGLTTFGRVAVNDELSDAVARLVKSTGYRGIADLDVRYDPRDGEYKLLDFNPRLGAQFRLFTDDAGIDVAIAAYIDLTGGHIPFGEVVPRGFLVENYDPVAALAYWRAGEVTAREWCRSLSDADELAWFARDDLVPFGLMCARMGWRVLRRPFGRARPSARHRTPRFRPGRARAKVSTTPGEKECHHA